MAPLDTFPTRYSDDDASDIESQISSSSDTEISPERIPKWLNRGKSRSCNLIVGIRELRSRADKEPELEVGGGRKARVRRAWKIVAILVVVLVIAAIAYISLVSTLVHRLSPSRIPNGLQSIVDHWEEPSSLGISEFEWREDFSRDIVPKNCHSHNDYWRTVPLYEALAAGCIGIEADIWLTDDNELLVSHTWRSTKRERTLKSLYLDPLANIFTNLNVSRASTEPREIGVFETDPDASVVLLIDFKSDGHETWPVLLEQLQPLRERGWLTYFDGKKVVPGPLTIVGTGNTPFDLVEQTNTNRFIFFDAPLDDISNPTYTSENSYYASAKLSKAVGPVWFNKLRSSQIETIKSQINAAKEKGLKSRYWSTPSWPVSLRDKVWFTLTENDVGMLNVDDLESATRWNWNWCVVAGLNLCGNQ